MISVLFLALIFRGSYGSFDEYISCESQARSSRQLKLPTNCDLSVNNFCFEKGHHYPDKAIKRFLRENLGLMKRMSSDMDGREVVREMRSGFNMWTEPKHSEDEEYESVDKSTNFPINMMPPGENIFNGLKYNIKYGSGLATIQNKRDESVKNKEQTTTRTSTTKTTTSQTTMIVTTVQSTSISDDTTQPTYSTFTTARKDASNDYIEPSTVTEQYQTSTIMDEQETTYEMQSRETPTETEPPINVENYYVDEYYQDNIQTEEDPIQISLIQEPLEVSVPNYVDIYPEVDNNNLDPIEELVEDIIEQNYQEIEELEEVEEEIEYVGESVNACEVDVTLEAPYYANNTRNEPLALLNLYPFEQYVHMERCKSEYDEMLCRPGCRCEQQYRLHRLLAFDPMNECRGIFSDWFRFPSNCICKCYNSARQLRELVRNPKSHKMGKQKSRKSGPGPTHNMAKSRLNNHRLMSVSGMDNMPAVFPYEGLAMITDEYNREEKEFRVPRRMGTPLETEIYERSFDEKDKLSNVADEHMDNVVESDQLHHKKHVKQARYLDDDFFFNQPIVGFKLSDGTTGSVEQVPRK